MTCPSFLLPGMGAAILGTERRKCAPSSAGPKSAVAASRMSRGAAASHAGDAAPYKGDEHSMIIFLLTLTPYFEQSRKAFIQPSSSKVRKWLALGV